MTIFYVWPFLLHSTMCAHSSTMLCLTSLLPGVLPFTKLKLIDKPARSMSVVHHIYYNVVTHPLISFVWIEIASKMYLMLLLIVWFPFVSCWVGCILCSPVGWRQPVRDSRAFGSPPPMSSRHRNSESWGGGTRQYILQVLCFITFIITQPHRTWLTLCTQILSMIWLEPNCFG